MTPGDPTTELLAALFMAKIGTFLASDGDRLRCVEIKIEETPTNTVIFTGDPSRFLPLRGGTPDRAPWWRRSDMDINELDRLVTIPA